MYARRTISVPLYNTFYRFSMNQNNLTRSFCTAEQTQLVQEDQQNKLEEMEFEAPPPLNPPNIPMISEDCFAVVHLSGKQQKLTNGDIILTEKLVNTKVGDVIRLDKVLLIGTKDSTFIGTPRVKDAYVMAEVQEQTKADKIVIFKKKRRKGYQRFRGFRPHITVLRILGVHYEIPTAESVKE